jgi:hypothetical protein
MEKLKRGRPKKIHEDFEPFNFRIEESRATKFKMVYQDEFQKRGDKGFSRTDLFREWIDNEYEKMRNRKSHKENRGK